MAYRYLGDLHIGLKLASGPSNAAGWLVEVVDFDSEHIIVKILKTLMPKIRAVGELMTITRIGDRWKDSWIEEGKSV